MLFGKKETFGPKKEDFMKCLEQYYALRAVNLTKAMFYDKERNLFSPFVPQYGKIKTLIMFPENVDERDYDDFNKHILMNKRNFRYQEVASDVEDLKDMRASEYMERQYQMASISAGIYPLRDTAKDDKIDTLRRHLDIKFLPKAAQWISDGKIDKEKISYAVLLDIGAIIGSLIGQMDVIYHGRGRHDAILASGLANWFDRNAETDTKCIETSDDKRIDISLISSRPDVFCVIYDGDEEIMNKDMCIWSMKKLLKHYEAGYIKTFVKTL